MESGALIEMRSQRINNSRQESISNRTSNIRLEFHILNFKPALLHFLTLFLHNLLLSLYIYI